MQEPSVRGTRVASTPHYLTLGFLLLLSTLTVFVLSGCASSSPQPVPSNAAANPTVEALNAQIEALSAQLATLQPTATPTPLPTPEATPTAEPILAAAAVLVIAVAALHDQAVSLDASRAETHELSQVTAVLGRLLSEPDHRVASLAAADGTKEGSVAWSNHDLAVITTALKEPSAGEVYRCWIERDGVRSPVGQMWFVGNLAYWTGSLDGWARSHSMTAGGSGSASNPPLAERPASPS